MTHNTLANEEPVIPCEVSMALTGDAVMRLTFLGPLENARIVRRMIDIIVPLCVVTRILKVDPPGTTLGLAHEFQINPKQRSTQIGLTPRK